jgi:hypothetical protein
LIIISEVTVRQSSIPGSFTLFLTKPIGAKFIFTGVYNQAN